MTHAHHTTEDLQVAGLILACKHRTCRITGAAWYTEDLITWAKQVFATFSKAAWSHVKRAGLTLKAAWAKIKAIGAAVFASVLRVIAENVRGKDLQAGRLARVVHHAPTMKVRSKDKQRQNRWDQTDRMQNSRQRSWIRNPFA